MVDQINENFPCNMPKYLRCIVYHLPLTEQAREKCEELYQLPWVEKVLYCPEVGSYIPTEGSEIPIDAVPCVIVRVNAARMEPNTPSRVEDMMLEILESDDAEKAEGPPPGTLS